MAGPSLRRRCSFPFRARPKNIWWALEIGIEEAGGDLQIDHATGLCGWPAVTIDARRRMPTHNSRDGHRDDGAGSMRARPCAVNSPRSGVELRSRRRRRHC